MINNFVGVGINHMTDSTHFLKVLLAKSRPDVITLEVPCNTNAYPTCPNTVSYDREEQNHEWSKVTRLAIERAIPYYCIDGNVDPEMYPWFDDVELAATTCFPADSGIWGNFYITYGEREVQVLAGRWDEAFSRTPHDVALNVPARNQFAGAVINRIAEHHGGLDRLVHIGGLDHFQYHSLIDPSVSGMIPLQDVVQARNKEILALPSEFASSARRKRRAYLSENQPTQS